MAKRLTDSDKWFHPWFRALPLKAKVIWIYMLDTCDHAGIWTVDLELASLLIGDKTKVTEEDILKWFGDKIVQISPQRVFIPGFLDFQYPNGLNTDNRAHSSVLSILAKHNIDLESLEAPSKGLASPKLGCKDKDKDKDMVKDKESIAAHKFDFDSLYEKYPRKEGKKKGLAKCRLEIKTQEKFIALSRAIDRYKEYCVREKKEPRFIRHFATFMGIWEDWTDPETGTSQLDLVSKSPTRPEDNPDTKAIHEHLRKLGLARDEF